MDSCEDRSACRRSTAVFRLAVVIARLVSAPLVGFRHTRTTVAPIWASASAVAFPIPELAPVTMQICPCMRVFDVGMMRSFLAVRLAFQESVDIVALSFMRPLLACELLMIHGDDDFPFGVAGLQITERFRHLT